MKPILLVSILFILIGCSSKLERMNSSMEPFMSQNFPDATYKIVVKDKLHQLKIDDPGNLVDESNTDEVMLKTFKEFYMVFYKYSNGGATDSEFQIVYENETSTWRSETHTLKDLSEFFNPR